MAQKGIIIYNSKIAAKEHTAFFLNFSYLSCTHPFEKEVLNMQIICLSLDNTRRKSGKSVVESFRLPNEKQTET